MKMQILKTDDREAKGALHARAREIVSRYKRCEAELVEILIQIDQQRVFLKYGHPSLFAYVVHELELSESVAYNLITVARKARVVPELKRELERGAITLSNARRIAPLLTTDMPGALSHQNSALNVSTPNSEWIQKAATLSQRALEKEIARVRPQALTPERASYVTASRVKLELGLPEREMLKLRRAQDLLSQSKRRAVSLEETLEALTSEYLKRHDPLEKAKRHCVKKGMQGGKPVSRPGDPEPVTQAIKLKDPIRTELVSRPVAKIEPKLGLRPDIKPQPKLVARPVATPRPQLASRPVARMQTKPVSRPEKTTRAPIPRGHARTPILRAHARTPIPRAIYHHVQLRDQGRRTYVHPQSDKRCNQRRWLEIHHVQPLSQGGTHALGNLTTLCATHHHHLHQKLSPVTNKK